MADSADAGIKRATGALSATEPIAKRQATEASVLGVPGVGGMAGANAVVSRGAATAEMATELKKKVKEALARRKQLLEQELQHLEAGGKLLDFAATVRAFSFSPRAGACFFYASLIFFHLLRQHFRVHSVTIAFVVLFPTWLTRETLRLLCVRAGWRWLRLEGQRCGIQGQE
jgi:hypothetical protein